MFMIVFTLFVSFNMQICVHVYLGDTKKKQLERFLFNENSRCEYIFENYLHMLTKSMGYMKDNNKAYIHNLQLFVEPS